VPPTEKEKATVKDANQMNLAETYALFLLIKKISSSSKKA